MAQTWTWAAYAGGSFGKGLVFCHGDRVARVFLPVREGDPAASLTGKELALREVLEREPGGFAGKIAEQLQAAFENGHDVTCLPIDLPEKVAPFKLKAIHACREIPKGKTISYRELARRAGNAEATRAAGNVMSGNRFPLIVPCHRVVASDGGLHNYGGGVEMKRWLLEKEGAF